MAGGELSVQAHRHPSGLWLTIPLSITGARTLAMVLDSGSPVSAINPETAEYLQSLSLLAPARSPLYTHRLTTVTIDGQPLPDLDVRVLPRLSRLGVVGLVGLDFLEQFLAVHYYVPTRRLVLEVP